MIPSILATLVTILFFKNKKISCYFCNYCKISRLLKAFLSSFKPKVLLNLWFLLVLWYLLPGLFSLLWFLQNLRTSQEPSLPSSLYEWTFVKFAILALFVPVIFLDNMKLIYMIFTFTIFAKCADFPAGVYRRSMHPSVPNDRSMDPRSMLWKSRFVTLNMTSHFKSHDSPHCTRKSLLWTTYHFEHTNLYFTHDMAVSISQFAFWKWHCIFNVAAHHFYTLISSLNTTSCFQSGDKDVFKNVPYRPP